MMFCFLCNTSLETQANVPRRLEHSAIKKAFFLIHGSLNESGDDLKSLIPDDLMPACFDICPHVGIFNEWHVYLVDTQAFSKVTCSKDGGNDIKTIRLARGQFDPIASPVYKELDSLLETYW